MLTELDKFRDVLFKYCSPDSVFMADDTDIFSSKLKKDHFWKYYEIKACLFRNDVDTQWQVIFMYARLLTDEISTIPNLPKTNHFRLIHEIYELGKLSDLLRQIRDKNV